MRRKDSWSFVLVGVIFGMMGWLSACGGAAKPTADIPELSLKDLTGSPEAGRAIAAPRLEKPPSPPAPPSPEAYALSLYEAVALALKRNKKIQVASFRPPQAVEDLKAARSVYDPVVFSGGNLQRVKRPIQSVLDTGSILEDKLIEDRWYLQVGVKKAFLTGGTVAIAQENDRLDSNSLLVVPNPQVPGRMVVEVNQPLLKGVFDKPNRAAIKIAKLNVGISQEEFRQVAMDVVAEVIRAYWQLFLERQVVDINRKNLNWAEEVYRREKVRMQRGLSKQLDVDRALAAMELRRGDLMRAQTRVQIVTEQLKLLLDLSGLLPATAREIIPVDRPDLRPVQVNREEAVATALQQRPEVERAQKAVEVGEVRRDLASHNRLPKLNAKFRFTRYGLGGNLGNSLDSVYSENNNSWLAGVELEYPLGNRGPEAEYRKRLMEYKQAAADLKRIKDQVVNEVEVALQELELARKELGTTRQAQEAAARVVQSENALFELGQRTNEELLRAQDLLAVAAREHVRAMANYTISLASLARARGTLLSDLGIEIEKEKNN